MSVQILITSLWGQIESDMVVKRLINPFNLNPKLERIAG